MEDRNLISVKPVTKICKEGQQKVGPRKLKLTSYSSASTSTQTHPSPKVSFQLYAIILRSQGFIFIF